MAAAYAELNQFDTAIEAAEHGLDAARNQGNNVIAEALQANAELYRTRLPLRTGLTYWPSVNASSTGGIC